jgi:hypothetical protein
MNDIPLLLLVLHMLRTGRITAVQAAEALQRAQRRSVTQEK